MSRQQFAEPARFRDHLESAEDAQRWDDKTRRVISRSVGEYVRAYARWRLEFPTHVTLFAEDYDCLDMIGRRTVSLEHDVRLVRGPSRAEYRL